MGRVTSTAGRAAPEPTPGQDAGQAAALLAEAWRGDLRLPGLPAALVPPDRAAAYAVQARRADLLGSATVGWKIAATSAVGQAHIGVDGPLAGRVLADTVHGPDDAVPLAGNAMCVAETEFVLVIGERVEPGGAIYDAASVLPLVADLRLGVELPSTRYDDPSTVGAEQLAADNACSGRFVLGPVVDPAWRDLDLAQVRVETVVEGTGGPGGRRTVQGSGAEVLGHPLAALAWLVDELSAHGTALERGAFVTTGTCHVPVPVRPGDRLVASYAGLGELTCSFS